MGTILAQTIAESAWLLVLEDATDPVRWKAPEALRWINNGQREAVTLVPAVNTKAAIKMLEPASARQTLAGLGITDGITVVKVPCNYDEDLETPGRSITLKELKHFEEMRPYWRREVATEAMSFMLDLNEPKVFYLHPAPRAGAVQVIYSAYPAKIIELANPITIDDIHANALEAYLLACFYAKDSEAAQAPAKVGYYMGRFAQLLGVTDQNVIRNLTAGFATSNAKGRS